MMASSENFDAAFGTLVAQTARQWRRAVNQQLEPYGLTEATWLPLLYLSRAKRRMNQKDLAAALSLDTSTVVRLLDDLQSSGLIERREGADRRAKMLHLTPQGRSTVAEVESVARSLRDRVLAGISRKNLATAAEVLQQICEALAVEEAVS